MYTHEQYRAFILRMADAETEAAIEEGILDGRIDPDHLRQIEEELIDDHLFGRLSTEEERIFRSDFLRAPERLLKLNFASALKEHAARHAPEVRRRTVFGKLRGMAAKPWFFPLATAMGCAVVAIVWLGERDLSLSHELSQVTQENDEHQRVIASMHEEQQLRASHFSSSIRPTTPQPGTLATEDQASIIELSPGVNRGLAVVPVLHVKKQASTVTIVLELPFTPKGTVREELLNSDDKQIWSQQFSDPSGISIHGLTTIVLPARLFATDEYRLRAEADASGDEPGNKAIYLFRVRKD
jgi:hypothetical protein